MKMTLLAAVTALAACAAEVDAPLTAAGGAAPAGDAETACVAAVRTTTGATGPLGVLSSEVSQAGTTVLVEVPGATAPWSCRVSTDGVIEETMFTGSEGYL